MPFNSLTEAIIFFVLIIIIGVLYVLLVRKNLFIKAILEKLNLSDSKNPREDLFNLISKVRLFELPKIIARDHFFDQNIHNYLFDNPFPMLVFLHYTMEENIAHKILKEGFQFRYSFYKTADRIKPDKLDLIYRHNRNKHYGNFIMVIAIDEKIFRHYVHEVGRSSNPGRPVEQILTEIPPYEDENQDQVFTLSNKFIKGFINFSTGKIVNNPEFKPDYDAAIFRQNLK